ncbi:hypothetical protein M0R45_025039 [Rubus argutus]|uniref:Uncharacterized protein n=1 Tax=Rubus argutus TaxID=59490 RepID=A0AAW1WUG8_RUBAR
MILMTLLTTTQCIINTTTITSSSSRCDGGSTDDPSCLIGEIHLDSEEFMMDSEISRRILAGTPPTKTSLNPAEAASRCDRPNGPPCHSNTDNFKARPPNCVGTSLNRECHRYDRK